MPLLPFHELPVQTLDILTPRDRPHGDFWDTHLHAEHKLLSAISLGITVITPSSVHVVHRGDSLWIPALLPHAVHADPGNFMHCSWFQPAIMPTALAHVATIHPSPLLASVLKHLTQEVDPARRQRAEAFALDLLSQSATRSYGIAQPRSPELALVTEALARNPADQRSVSQWARTLSVSTRTFSRRFRDETGMSFSQWRSRLRIDAARTHLAAGDSVGSVAQAVGFTGPSAFVAWFRREVGVTPLSYARDAETRWPERPE